ncbi:hypothetical protein B0T21DRAFT_347283 [Apiosordaria backusii]|uniref:Uncharacterized protein n=1 Tax=Apiosordaria backusii TaxID=314023 RepID=A0AA40EGH8_9PEZI|nr:hypothetical protein B0T21DRAFT_347283 [Apiosordaria backusii]
MSLGSLAAIRGAPGAAIQGSGVRVDLSVQLRYLDGQVHTRQPFQFPGCSYTEEFIFILLICLHKRRTWKLPSSPGTGGTALHVLEEPQATGKQAIFPVQSQSRQTLALDPAGTVKPPTATAMAVYPFTDSLEVSGDGSGDLPLFPSLSPVRLPMDSERRQSGPVMAEYVRATGPPGWAPLPRWALRAPQSIIPGYSSQSLVLLQEPGALASRLFDDTGWGMVTGLTSRFGSRRRCETSSLPSPSRRPDCYFFCWLRAGYGVKTAPVCESASPRTWDLICSQLILSPLSTFITEHRNDSHFSLWSADALSMTSLSLPGPKGIPPHGGLS